MIKNNYLINLKFTLSITAKNCLMLNQLSKFVCESGKGLHDLNIAFIDKKYEYRHSNY